MISPVPQETDRAHLSLLSVHHEYVVGPPCQESERESWQPCSLTTFSRSWTVRVHSPNSASGYDRSYLTSVRSCREFISRASALPRSSLTLSLNYDRSNDFRVLSKSRRLLLLRLASITFHSSFLSFFRVPVNPTTQGYFAASRIFR